MLLQRTDWRRIHHDPFGGPIFFLTGYFSTIALLYLFMSTTQYKIKSKYTNYILHNISNNVLM